MCKETIKKIIPLDNEPHKLASRVYTIDRNNEVKQQVDKVKLMNQGIERATIRRALQ